MREDQPEADAGGTIGARLRVRREAEGLSLDEVADRTRVPIRHLAAIEASDYSALPAAPYAVGFVKSYARVLGEPPDEAGRLFRTELDAVGQGLPQQQAFEPADPARVPPLRLAVVALIVAVVFAVGYASWRAGLFGRDTPDARAALAANGSLDQPPAAAPAARAPAAAPAGAAAGSGPVVITATATAWIRVSDGDRRLFMGVMKPNDRFVVPPGSASPVIRTAAAQALRITVGDTAVPSLAPPSTLVKDASLKPADLLARGQGAPLVPAPAGQAAPAMSSAASDRSSVPRHARRHPASARAESAPSANPSPTPTPTPQTAPANTAPADTSPPGA